MGCLQLVALLACGAAAELTIGDETWAAGSPHEVRLKVLSNSQTGELVKVIVSPGGRVEELRLRDRHTGRLRDVLQGHSGNASDVWANLHWRGAMLAPFANRIANGSYQFDGRSYYMPRNEAPARQCALHGFLHDKPLTVAHQAAGEEAAELVLEHQFGEDPGYPFKVKISISYKLHAGGDGLEIAVRATNMAGDGSEAPFFVGMHPYFKVEDVSKAEVIMDRACAEYLHVDMPAGAPREGSLIPTLRTSAWTGFDGSKPIGGAKDKPTYFDDEFKAAELKACQPGSHPYDVAMRTLIKDAAGGAVLWQDDKYLYNQIFTGSRELWGDSAVAFEPMSAKADAYNNHDGLTVLSDGQTWSGSFGIYAASALDPFKEKQC